jgi:iron(III) transport system substrate-binding protein
MKKNLVGVSVLALGLLAGLHIPAMSAPATVDFTTYDGADRNELLLAAAQKEGELTVYHVYPVLTAVEAAFTKKYGIKIKNWRADSESVLNRVVSEAHGGRNDVDIVQNESAENQALHREKLLAPINSPYQKNLIAEAMPNHKEWTGITIDVYVAAYNTNHVKKEDLPKTYQDLLDPKWKGKLSVEANDYLWFSSLLSAMGEEKGRKLFSDIVATNGMSFRKGHTLLSTLVASGEATMGLSAYYLTVTPLKKKGAPIDYIALQPLIAQLGAIGVTRKAPHPAAAMLFYDFVLNEGEQIMSDEGYAVTSKKIKSPFAGVPMKMVDPDVALDNQAQWTKNYNEVLMVKSK